MRKPLPNALDIDIAGGLTPEVTPHAGVGLLVELGRLSGVMAATARQWLDQFHDASALAERPKQGSFISRESDRLAGLRAVLRHCLLSYVVSQKPGAELTMDVDAHLVESSKQAALPAYEGYRGYQPMLVSWAETGLVLADEFRDGNVPASKDTDRVVDEAYESLPPRAGGWQVSVRSDAAAYEQDVLDHWAERGWRFAVSAGMSRQLRAEIEALAPEAWQDWRVEAKGYVREWAEVAFGANAAWLRLQVLTLNLLQLLKLSALDESYRNARPKRLRFAVFTQFGCVVRHARQQVLRIVTGAWEALVQPGRRRLGALVWAPP